MTRPRKHIDLKDSDTPIYMKLKSKFQKRTSGPDNEVMQTWNSYGSKAGKGQIW